LGVEGSYPIDGQPTWTARCCYRTCDWMQCPRLHTATGFTSMDLDLCGCCRRQTPEMRNLDLCPQRRGRSAKSQSRPPPGWKRVGVIGPAQRLGQGYKSQRGDGVRASTSTCGNHAHAPCAVAGLSSPRTIRVGAREKAGRKPQSRVALAPAPAYHRRDVCAGNGLRSTSDGLLRHPNWHRDTHPRIEEFRVADGALEPRRRVGHGNKGPWPCGAAAVVRMGAAHTCDHDRLSACSSMLHVAS
jgi:hypothetical protein